MLLLFLRHVLGVRYLLRCHFIAFKEWSDLFRLFIIVSSMLMWGTQWTHLRIVVRLYPAHFLRMRWTPHPKIHLLETIMIERNKSLYSLKAMSCHLSKYRTPSICLRNQCTNFSKTVPKQKERRMQRSLIFWEFWTLRKYISIREAYVHWTDSRCGLRKFHPIITAIPYNYFAVVPAWSIS
jgi:hypothetical protein